MVSRDYNGARDYNGGLGTTMGPGDHNEVHVTREPRDHRVAWGPQGGLETIMEVWGPQWVLETLIGHGDHN